MKRTLLLLVASCAVTGCGGAKIQKQQEEIQTLQEKAGTLLGQLKEKENRVEALEAKAGELEGQVKDLDLKLKSAGARIDSLSKSNQDLSQSMQSSAGQQSSKIAELVAEKDELSRRLNELEKEKIAALRDASRFAAQREKYLRAAAALRQEKDEAARRLAAAEARLASADGAKAAEDKARSARVARVREDLGALADAILKELQSERAKLEQKGEAIELTLQEPALFEAGKAQLTEAGGALLDRVAAAVRGLTPRPLRLEAHCDNAAVKKELFGGYSGPWELAAARAAAAARRLQEQGGIDPGRLTATGVARLRAGSRRVVLVLEANALP